MGRVNLYLSDDDERIAAAAKARGVNLSAALRAGLATVLELADRCPHDALACHRCGTTVERRANLEAPALQTVARTIETRLYYGDPVLTSLDAYAVVHDVVHRWGVAIASPATWDRDVLARRGITPTSPAAAFIAAERAAAVREHVGAEAAAAPTPLPTSAELEAGRASARRRHPTARPTEAAPAAESEAA